MLDCLLGTRCRGSTTWSRGPATPCPVHSLQICSSGNHQSARTHTSGVFSGAHIPRENSTAQTYIGRIQWREDPRARVRFVPRSTARICQHAETQTLGDETQTLASASASAFPAEAAVASGNTVPLEAMATYTVDYTGIPGHVYTLLLESGRFYVGWSSAVEYRIAQHFSGAGSKWTMQNKPLQVLACVAGDTTLEDVVTISLMCQHGWERVRGGRWCQLALGGPPDAVRRAMLPRELGPKPCSGPAETDVGPCSASQDKAQSGAPERMQEEQREERETITLTRSRADGEQHAWRAEIRSAQAAAECAKRGFKCIYGATLQEAATKNPDWRADSAKPRQATAEWA